MSNKEDSDVAWIVGAAGGIGSEFARIAATRGMRAVLSGGARSDLEALADRHGGPGSSAVVELDLSDSEALPAAAEAAWAAFGRIDLLILNAGISQRARATETDLAVLQRIMQIDFLSQAEIARRIAARMIEQKSGAILVVSSLAGLVASPLRTGYCAAKHAIFGYYNSLRAELVDQGITVTIGVPGFVRTEISRNAVIAGGALYGKMDPNQQGGTDPVQVASRLLDATLRGRREIRLAMGLKGRLAIFLAKNLPSIYARIIARARVT